MLPVPLITSLGHSNTDPEALRERGNGAAAGPSCRRAPRLLFMPCRVRLVALVIVVVLFLFGTAGNEIPASSEEPTSSAAMAPPWSASAQASAPPPFFLSRPIGFQRPRLHTPSGLCNRSTVDAVHARTTGRSTRTVVDRANPGTTRGPPVDQRRGQPRTARDFAL